MKKVKLLVSIFFLLALFAVLTACAGEELTYVPAKAATCDLNGCIEYWYQESTGKYFADAEGTIELTKDATVLQPVGHSYSEEYAVIEAPTCTEMGTEGIFCTVCGKLVTQKLEPLGHAYSVVSTATCDKDGEERGSCDRCGKTIVNAVSASHRYGAWETAVAPTLTSEGSLVRVCTLNESHKETYPLPKLSERSEYTIHTTDGNETVTLPTFTAAGEAFYKLRISNQSFFYKASLPKLDAYYADLDGAIYVPIQNATYSGEGAAFDSESRTLTLTNNKDTVSFSVTAEKAGFYAVYLKYANKNNLSTMLEIHNDSDTAFTGYGYSWLDGSEKTSDMLYTLREHELLADFSANASGMIYLKEGENKLRLIFSRQIGISDILFLSEKTDLSAVHPYSGTLTSNNGYKINGGKSVEVKMTVPEDGTYTLYAMMSTSGGDVRIDSKNGSFTAVQATYPAVVGRSALTGTYTVPSTYLRELGTLSLTKGEHTLRFTLKEGYSFFHFNYLALSRVGALPSDKGMSVDFTRTLASETHTLTLDAYVSGVASNQSPKMTVVFEGYYTHEDGSETPFSQAQSKTAYDQSFTFATTPLTGNMDGVSYRMKVYNEQKTELLYETKLYHYSIRDTLTVFMITDLHHTGSNLTQLLRNYRYAETEAGAFLEVVLKTRNSNSTACDIYGMSTDEKVQRVIDDVIQRYEAGEIDMVFFLGDQSMNDGNYYHYATEHMMYENQPHYGQSIDDFWNSPLNLDLIMQEQYFSQLAERGIPYFLANGNHDYVFDYSENKIDIDYSAREKRYHYQELFGHKNEDGIYYDATPTNFFVRVIRRDGEVKILSALSETELAIFRETYQNDSNCYDYYVSEDTLSESDIILGAFMMVDTYQFDSLDYYMNYYVYMKKPDGSVDLAKKDYHGQTIRSDYHNLDVIEEMAAMMDGFTSVYMVSHNYCEDLSDFIAAHDNIEGMFMGDLHEQTYKRFAGLAQNWVVGQFACAFDVKYYYERDSVTGESTKIADSQYYYTKNGKVGNVIGGSYEYLPFSHGTFHIKGNEGYFVRENIGYYYQNTEPQYNIMFDRVVGWDPMYERAVDYTHEAGESFKVGDRTVFVGGDTFIAGEGPTHIQIARSYTPYQYNAPEYMLSPTETALVYTVCDTAGRALNADGKPVVVNGGTVLTVTLSSTAEGTTLTLFGETYYTVSKSGGVVGHYLYDENRDYVYVDQNGNYVFYDFYKDENGDFMTEYFFEDENGNFVALGYWNDDHTKYTLYDGTYTHLGGSYVDENGVTKTTAGIWLSGDTMTVSGIDHTTEIDPEEEIDEFANKVIVQYKNGKYRTETASLVIQNGIIIRGEGFMHKSYTYRFVDAYGNEVDKSTVKRTQKVTYTYTLKDRESYKPGDALTAASFVRTDNGLSDIYGYYVPHMEYAEAWIDR